MTHEWGHIYLHPVMPMEAEAVVNVPTAIVQNLIFDTDFDHCMTNVYAKYTRDQAMWDWVTSQNFRRGYDMSVDTLPDGTVGWKMLQYQQRGYAKYIDLADMLGWDAFREINFEFKSRYDTDDDYVNQVTRDDYVFTASGVLNVDIRPLFHFWGIHESDTLKPHMDILPESDWIRDRLYYYYSIIPTDFQEVYDANFPTNPNSLFYPVAINYFDSTWVTQMRTVTQGIMNKYFTPYAPTITDIELIGDQFQISWEDNDPLIGDAFIVAYIDETSTDTIYAATLPKQTDSYILSVPDTSCYTILLACTNDKGTSNWAEVTGNCNTTTSAENTFAGHEPFIFPNPGKGQYFLSGIEGYSYEISVFNNMGARILTTQINHGQFIDLRKNPSGLYYFMINRISDDKTIWGRRVVKQ